MAARTALAAPLARRPRRGDRARPARAARAARHGDPAGARGAAAFRELGTFGEPPATKETALSPVADLLAVAGADGAIRLWDLRSRNRAHVLRTDLHRRTGHDAVALCLAFSPDGSLLASAHVDGVVHLWDMAKGEEVPVRLRHDESVGTLAFSPDGATLATGSLDANLRLWDVGAALAGEARRELIRQPSGVTALAWAGGGEWILTGHSTRVLRLTDPHRSRLLATLRGPEALVSLLALSPDGRHMAVASHDRTVRLYDLATREQTALLTGLRRPATALCFLADGGFLATVCQENAVQLWDLETRSPGRRSGGRPARASSASRCSASRTTSRWPWPTAASASGARRTEARLRRHGAGADPAPGTGERSGRRPLPAFFEPGGSAPSSTPGLPVLRESISVLSLQQAHAVEGEVVLHRVVGVELAEAARHVERHRPARRAVAGEADPAGDREGVGVDREHELRGVRPPPDAEVHAVAARHPAQVEVEALAGAPRLRGREEVAHAGVLRQAPAAVEAAVVEGEGPRREGGEGRAHVGVGGREALGEEGLHRAVRGAHLLRQEQQAGHVAPVEPAVAEGARAARPAARGRAPSTASAGRGPRASEHRRDAAP